MGRSASDYPAPFLRGGSMTAILKKHMPDAYKRVARMVGYCLLLGDDADNWHGLTDVLTERLTMRQRAAMAWAVLRSLPPETVADVANTVLPQGAGMPIAPFIDPVDEASFWADMATPDELDAYAVAIFNAMSGGKRRAFLDFAGRAAA